MRSILVLTLLLLFALQSATAQYSAVNRTLRLTGSGHVSVSNTYDLNGALSYGGRISIDAWVYASSITAQMAVIGNMDTYGYWFGVSQGGKVRFRAAPGIDYQSTSGITAGAWHHIAVSYDANKGDLRFYINGSLNRSVSISQGWLESNFSELNIGGNRGVTGGFVDRWKGLLDEVRIWSTPINFTSATGLLYRIPHIPWSGRYGSELVSAWRFNGDLLDATTGYHGSQVGTLAYQNSSLPPHYSRIALVMSNGTTGVHDVVEIPDHSSLSLRQNYTIELWVKPASTGGHATYQVLFCKGSSSQSIWSIWLGLNKGNGKIRFVPNGQGNQWFESDAGLPVGQWTHVAVRYQTISKQQRIASIFLNGRLSSQRSYTSDAAANRYSMYIGAMTSDPSANLLYRYAGALDELRVWTTARSDDEIGDNHRLEFSGVKTDLEAVYRFDGDFLDASGHGHHGTIPSRNLDLYTPTDFYFNDASGLPAFPTLALNVPDGGENWEIGASQTVKWSASGLVNVKVELSRDGGNSYPEVLAASVDASSGTLNWTATGPETQKARIRVSTLTATSLSDASSSVFTISDPKPVLYVMPDRIEVTVSQNGPLPPPQTVQMENIGGGTLLWDASWGGSSWMNVSPTSGKGNFSSFEVSFTTTSLMAGPYSDTIVIGGNAENAGFRIPVMYRVSGVKLWSITGHVLDVTGAPVPGIPVKASGAWDREAVTDGLGVYSIYDLPAGDYIVRPVSSYYDFTPEFREFLPLNNNESSVNFTAEAAYRRLLLRYKEGWNLLSLPVDPGPVALLDVFPDAIPPAYVYDPDSGYVTRTELIFGEGYWIKFPDTDSVEVQGKLEPDLLLRLVDTHGGWNLIGIPSGPVEVGAIEQNPDSSIVVVYEYDPVHGYLQALDLIYPGRAYFVKSAAAADILMHALEIPYPEPPAALRFPGASMVLPPPPPGTGAEYKPLE